MAAELTRRGFIATALGTGALAVPLAGQAGAATNTVYRLNPDWGAGNPGCVPNSGQSTCGGCAACVKHDANKLFATSADADAGRAHAHCKCVIETALVVDAATYGRLFATSTSTDRRYAGVNETLAASTAAPTSDPTTTSAADGTLAFTGSNLPGLAVLGAGAVAVGAALRAAGRRGAASSS